MNDILHKLPEFVGNHVALVALFVILLVALIATQVMELFSKTKELTLTGDNESQLHAVRKVLVEKMIKRGVDPKSLEDQKLEQATHNTVRQKVKLKEGIDKDTAKSIQKQIKDLKLKGSSQVIKGGTKAKGIRLVDGDHEISCKIDGAAIGLKACFVKKA